MIVLFIYIYIAAFEYDFNYDFTILFKPNDPSSAVIEIENVLLGLNFMVTRSSTRSRCRNIIIICKV